MPTIEQFIPFVPEIFLAVAGLVLLLAAIPFGKKGTRSLAWLAVASLAVTIPRCGPGCGMHCDHSRGRR